MKLQRVVSAERNPQSSREVLRQRVAVVPQKEGVVTERGHGYEDLRQVVHVLEDWHLDTRNRMQYLVRTAAQSIEEERNNDDAQDYSQFIGILKLIMYSFT